MTVERHNALSRFAAPFLSRMSFLDEHEEGASPTIKAVRTYRELRTSGRRTLPPDTPVDFAPKALESLIRRNGAIDRRRWESALFLKVRDEIRAGNLAIDGAKNFGRFESFFLPEPQWQQTSEAFWARTGFLAEPDSAAQQLKARLSAAFDRFLEDVPRNRQVSFDDDGWRLKADRAEQPDPEQSASLVELRRWLDARRRSVRLADLLIEVENDLRFSAHFLRPGEKQADTVEVCALLAALPVAGNGRTGRVLLCRSGTAPPPPWPTFAPPFPPPLICGADVLPGVARANSEGLDPGYRPRVRERAHPSARICQKKTSVSDDPPCYPEWNDFPVP